MMRDERHTDPANMAEPMMPETATVDRPGVRLRPGVVYPDWSVVTSDAVVQMLAAYIDASGQVRRWSAITEVEDRVRRVILEHYGATGRPPSEREMSSATGLAPRALSDVLAGLEARDMVLLDDDGGGVAGAYPFTEDDTAHRVTLDGRIINTMCAIDALGVGAMYDRDVVIASRCLTCGGPVRVETHDRGRALKRYTPARTVVWLGTGYAGGCAAKSACKSMAFFCSDDHLASWRKDGGAEGFRLSIDEGLQAGRASFQPFLAPARPN